MFVRPRRPDGLTQTLPTRGLDQQRLKKIEKEKKACLHI